MGRWYHLALLIDLRATSQINGFLPAECFNGCLESLKFSDFSFLYVPNWWIGFTLVLKIIGILIKKTSNQEHREPCHSSNHKQLFGPLVTVCVFSSLYWKTHEQSHKRTSNSSRLKIISQNSWAITQKPWAKFLMKTACWWEFQYPREPSWGLMSSSWELTSPHEFFHEEKIPRDLFL